MAMTTALHAVWLRLFLHRIGSNRLRVLTRVRLLSNCLFAVLSFVFDHEFLSLANLTPDREPPVPPELRPEFLTALFLALLSLLGRSLSLLSDKHRPGRSTVQIDDFSGYRDPLLAATRLP